MLARVSDSQLVLFSNAIISPSEPFWIPAISKNIANIDR